MLKRNREIRVRGKHPLTDLRAKILSYCIFLKDFSMIKSGKRNYSHTLLYGKKGITWPLMTGETGYPSQYLSHAERVPFHLS